jgi:hypothetical protein
MEAWLRSGLDRGRAARWAGVAVLSLFLAGFASPAAAASEEEKGPAAPALGLGLAPGGGPVVSFFRWLSGLAPGAARDRFGLGLETFFEHQESLRITSMESSFTLRDLALGVEEGGVLHGDPGLLNRKFDVVWEMEGAGVELPVALQVFGGFAESTLVLRAATADVTLDFLDRVRRQDSTSLNGRGALLGAELNVAAALSPNSPWFTEASYGFQRIHRFTAERSPRFGPAGFEVLGNRVRLGRDVQEIATRIGYGFSGNRITAYTGVLHRWTDLDIEDVLRYRDPLGTTETHLSSHTELESDLTLSVAGLEYRHGDQLRGRLEASVGKEDWGVLFKASYRARSPRTREEIEAFAVSVAPQLAEIEAAFRECRKVLALKAHPTPEVARLLDWTETQLLEVIHLEELDPLRASIQLRFRGFREELGLAQPSAGEDPETPCDRTGIAPAAYRLAQGGRGRRPPEGTFVQILTEVGDLLLRATGLASTGSFTLNLCVDSEPRRVKFHMHSPGHRGGQRGKTAKLTWAPRGMYSFEFRYNRRTHKCPEDQNDTCLDLWESDGVQLIECKLQTNDCEARPMPPQGCPTR